MTEIKTKKNKYVIIIDMKRSRLGSTPKQYAYAQLRLTGGGRSKNEIARKAGFSPSVANNAKNKIESTEGYHNAMLELAQKSNNVLLSIITEYEIRGLKNFSNTELNSAVNAISGAWDRIENRRAPARSKDPEQNLLRKAIIQKVEQQTINMVQPTKISEPKTVKTKEEDNEF